MGYSTSLPELEDVLVAQDSPLRQLSNEEYASVVERWSEVFLPLIEQNNPALHGLPVLIEMPNLLPGDLIFFSGVPMRRLHNTGGRGPVAYQANNVTSLDESILSSLELIVMDTDFTWCLPFSHESGALVHEELYFA